MVKVTELLSNSEKLKIERDITRQLFVAESCIIVAMFTLFSLALSVLDQQFYNYAIIFCTSGFYCILQIVPNHSSLQNVIKIQPYIPSFILGFCIGTLLGAVSK